MSDATKPDSSGNLTRNLFEAALRLGVLLVIIVWCFDIVRPFISLFAWALVLAIAIHPLYLRCLEAMGGRAKLTALLVTLGMQLLLVVPIILLAGDMVKNIEYVAEGVQSGEIRVPQPPPEVASLPIVGEPLDKVWNLASTNVGAVLGHSSSQIKSTGVWLLKAAAGTGFSLLSFIVSMGIAGLLMANSEVGRKFTRDIARRLAPEQGEQFVDLAEETTQGVARGILGVAVVQALLAGMGMLVAGVPGAGILAMVCLITAAVQIGIWPVMVGATIYMWIEATTLPALLFTVWAVVVTPVDGILRPIWIGRGLDLPIAVILVGTIGGMLAFGIIGLFAGAVVLAIGYKLLMSWLKPEGEPETA